MHIRPTALLAGLLIISATCARAVPAPIVVPNAPSPVSEADLSGSATVVREFEELPGLRMFVEGTNWVLTSNLVYRIGRTNDKIIVPAGFVTDFASIPAPLQSLISASGPYSYPAIVHDYLYWEPGCGKGAADRIFEIAMRETKVPWLKREAMYQAVNLFGDTAFVQNARDRAAGRPRILPPAYRNFPPSFRTWEGVPGGYRRYVYDRGVRPEPRVKIPPSFCAWGQKGAPTPLGVRP